ncbi:MAG: hypothetical protein HAW61_01300 [Candidatus Portiera sp.]|nr:hypothetical protein [Portiera sp.]
MNSNLETTVITLGTSFHKVLGELLVASKDSSYISVITTKTNTNNSSTAATSCHAAYSFYSS